MQENTWNEYKNPVLNWLGKMYIEDDDEDEPVFSPLWGDSELFSAHDIPELKKTLKKVKNNPGEIVFYSFQTDERSLLYFFYMNKKFPYFVYIGEVNVASLVSRLTYSDKNFYNSGKILYIINDDMVVFGSDHSDQKVERIIQFLLAEKNSPKEDSYAIKIQKDGISTSYKPIFSPLGTLWVLIVDSSVNKKDSYSTNIFIFFTLPILFLVLLNFIIFLFFMKPILTISSFLKSEKIMDLEKFTHFIKEIISKKRYIYFHEVYKILHVLKAMSDELLNYKKNDDYKLVQHKRSVELEYLERYRYEKQQRESAIYDSLTGLPNRFLLEDRIETSIRHIARIKRGVCLVFVDIINIKNIAEEYSHIVSDSMIKSLSVRLNEKVSSTGTLYRYDYTKFAFLLINIKADYDIQFLISQIFNVINDSSAYFESPLSEGLPLNVSCSIGVGMATSPKFTMNKLVKAAIESSEFCIVDEYNRLCNNFKVNKVPKL